MQATQQRFDRGDIRQMNTNSVLNLLRCKTSLSRAQIASELGLTRATVSKIALDLLDASLLEETHLTEGGSGRPGMLLRLNADYGCIVAVEIDLDRVSIIVADFSRTVFWRQEAPLDVEVEATDSLEFIAGMVEAALEAGSSRQLSCLGVGVAWAGLVAHEAGCLVYGPSSGWKNIPLKTLWEERFGVSIYIENEANAAVIGCHNSDDFPRNANLIYLSLGVGLAAGVTSAGQLLRGRMGYAGQVGHIPFSNNGVTCGCGRKGCWVTEIGAGAVYRRLAAHGMKISSLRGYGDDPLLLVYEKASSGDEIVRKVLIEVGQQVARGVAQLVQTLNPSALVLGGRLGKCMKLVEAEIRETINALALPGMLEGFEFRVSDTNEEPLLGSFAIVYDAILRDPFRFGKKPLFDNCSFEEVVL